MIEMLVLFVSRVLGVFIAAFLQKAVIANHRGWATLLSTVRGVTESLNIGLLANAFIQDSVSGFLIALTVSCAGGAVGLNAGMSVGNFFLHRKPPI